MTQAWLVLIGVTLSMLCIGGAACAWQMWGPLIALDAVMHYCF